MSFVRDGQEIGRGTYGVVYSGIFEHLDGRKERAALKQCFYKHNISGSGIYREIQILATISQKCPFAPKLIKVLFSEYEEKSTDLSVEKKETITFITELLNFNGCSFFGKIAYDMETIIDLTSQFIIAVSYMHNRLITHRDIKPSNILISYSKNSKKIALKLCDFGFSQFLINSEPSTPETNTPWYRPPEICWSITKYGELSDVWAVGATIYEILTGNILMDGCPLDQSALFNEMLIRIPSQWTKTIHSKYLRNSNMPIKIRGSLEPCNIMPEETFIKKFITSKYYKREDHQKWLSFEKLLKDCFNYDYSTRTNCWDLLNNDVFYPIRDKFKSYQNDMKEIRINELIHISVPKELNSKKVEFFTKFVKKNPNFPIRQLFHSVDLINIIFEKLDIYNFDGSPEKIMSGCIYFYHKFFSTLVLPQKVDNFFIDVEKVTSHEDYLKLDRWVYNFELKVIREIYPNFKIYRFGIFEMPDEYKQTLTKREMTLLFLEFITIDFWNNGTYRKMYREFYLKLINSDYVFG
jgi:serine/threonine protein kinase